MHRSFVTTASPPPPPTGNSGDNDFSSVTALHCGDLLGVMALLFIMVNSTRVYLHNITSRHLRNITSPALTRIVGELERSLPRTLAPLSPAHPRRWRAVVTNDRCINQCWVSIFLSVTDNCPARISGRKIMAVEIILWPYLYECYGAGHEDRTRDLLSPVGRPIQQLSAFFSVRLMVTHGSTFLLRTQTDQTLRMPELTVKFAEPTDQCVGFVVLRLNCARNRLGIVEVLRVKFYHMLSVPGKESLPCKGLVVSFA